MAEKKVSKTDLYKQHLQRIIYQQLGVKVSKDKAWQLFKGVQKGTLEFVTKLEDHKLPLAGIGTYEIIETKPRGSKAGLDKDGKPIEGAKPWPCVPRYRFYPSSVIDDLVEKAYGLGDHDDVKEEHYGLYVEANDSVPEESTEEPVKEGPVDVEPKKEVTKEEPVDVFDELDEI